MYVTTCMVVPLVKDTLPNEGALKNEQGLATQVGAETADHILSALATPVHVVETAPVIV